MHVNILDTTGKHFKAAFIGD